jgi:hypothetical protein
MIAIVKSISEKNGTSAKGPYTLYSLVLESEGKEVKLTTFDAADHATFKQAFDSQQFVDVETVVEAGKDDKNYTKIKKVFMLAAKVLPPEPNTPLKEAVKLGAVVVDEGDKRDRSMAVSYAKDLACVGKIELADIAKYANKFLDYILERKKE